MDVTYSYVSEGNKMTLARVVRKGSYQGVAQWGINTSAEITPSRKTAQKWADLENARSIPCGAKIPTIAVNNGQTRCYICTAKESHAIAQLARIEKILIANGAQASRAYGHGNDAAGPEIRGLWDAYQIVNAIRAAWIESL